MSSFHGGLTCVVVVMVCACVGCDQATPRSVAIYPVDGQVVYQGKPATGAVITFHPLDSVEQPPLACEVRANGHYVPTQADGAIGLPEGSYALTLQWKEGQTDPFAGRYAQPSSPLLKVKVESTVNLLPPIKLK